MPTRIRRRLSPCRRYAAAVLAAGLLLGTGPALALSELPQEDVTPPPEIQMVPLPPPLANPDNVEPEPERTVAPETPLPEIHYDLSLLPEPVRQTRERIVAACKQGDLEALRPLIETGGDDATQLSLSAFEGDPIELLRDFSGDDQGHEILAILEEVLEAGYVHLYPGTENEIYLWPYFFAVPLDTLTPPQRVELFRLVTAGDYEDMKSFGAYIFYRIGIRPDGRWAFFLAGD